MTGKMTPWAERRLGARLALRRAVPSAKLAAGALRAGWNGLVRRLPSAIDLPFADIRPADPAIGEQIYTGRFPLARRLLYTDGVAPFALKAPTPQFARALHGFGWLRHIAALDSDLGSANARSLLTAWLAHEPRDPAVWRDDVTAARLLALLGNNRLLLRGADAGFVATYGRTVARHLHRLQARVAVIRPSETRIRARIAIVAALLVMPGSAASLRRALVRLGEELEAGVNADGGHVSRSPAAMMELLADLVPLRLALADEAVAVPQALQSAIDRMFPALRFFRHMDGEPALFNGTGAVLPDRLTSLFAHDDTGAATPLRLARTGYERLAMGGTAIIADTGPVPDGEASATPHAGTLSFEMSSGRHRYVVNAGDDPLLPDDLARLPRQTSTHSTLCIEEASSSRFTGNARLAELLGGPLLEGPGTVSCERIDGPGRQGFTAVHSGYAARHGVRHERTVVLSNGGGLVEGLDRLVPVSGISRPRAATAAVRFHLHPDIHVILDGDDNFVLIADGDHSWTFVAEGIEPKLMEAISFAGVAGSRRSKMISLDFDTGERQEVRWRFLRHGG